MQKVVTSRYSPWTFPDLSCVDIYIYIYTCVCIRVRESSLFTFVRNRGRLIGGSIYRESLDIDFIGVDKIKLEIGYFNCCFHYRMETFGFF